MAGEPIALQSLAGYKILGEIGRGGMGIVYEAEEPVTGRRVALKVLPGAFALDATSLERFRREAIAATKIDHPNIVPVLHVGRDRGIHFIVLRLTPGRSLKQRLESKERSAVAELVRAFAGVADALEAAHRAGVLHRDVKPSNLLCDESGKVWLTDFGVARVEGAASLTMTGEALGTPYYMAPEQARGEDLDARADVYGLGATLYEAATGKRPFDGTTSGDVLRAVMDKEPIDPRRLNSEVSPELAAVILKSMEKEPAKRYPTAAAMADDLRRVAEGTAPRAGRVTWRRRAVRAALRWPERAGYAGIALTLYLLMLILPVLISFVLMLVNPALPSRLSRDFDKPKWAILGATTYGIMALGGMAFALRGIVSKQSETICLFAGLLHALTLCAAAGIATRMWMWFICSDIGFSLSTDSLELGVPKTWDNNWNILALAGATLLGSAGYAFAVAWPRWWTILPGTLALATVPATILWRFSSFELRLVEFYGPLGVMTCVSAIGAVWAIPRRGRRTGRWMFAHLCALALMIWGISALGRMERDRLKTEFTVMRLRSANPLMGPLPYLSDDVWKGIPRDVSIRWSVVRPRDREEFVQALSVPGMSYRTDLWECALCFDLTTPELDALARASDSRQFMDAAYGGSTRYGALFGVSEDSWRGLDPTRLPVLSRGRFGFSSVVSPYRSEGSVGQRVLIEWSASQLNNLETQGNAYVWVNSRLGNNERRLKTAICGGEASRDEFKHWCNGSDAEYRRWGAVGLGQLEHPPLDILESLLGDWNDQVRGAAMESLSVRAPERALGRFKAMQHLPDAPLVVYRALRNLGTSAEPWLLEFWRSHPKDLCRFPVACSLAALDRPESLPLLERYLRFYLAEKQHPHPRGTQRTEFEIAAVDAVTRMSRAEALPAQSLALKIGWPKLAAPALVRMGSDRAAEVLNSCEKAMTRALETDPLDHRAWHYLAWISLVRGGPSPETKPSDEKCPSCVAALAEMAQRRGDDVEAARWRVRYAIQSWGGDEALMERLLEVAPLVRKHGLTVLQGEVGSFVSSLVEKANRLARGHRFEDAFRVYDYATALGPDDLWLLNDYAWTLATYRWPDDKHPIVSPGPESTRAVELAAKAGAIAGRAVAEAPDVPIESLPRPSSGPKKIGPKKTMAQKARDDFLLILDTWAAACFSAGDRARAVELQERAIQLGPTEKDLPAMQARLAVYQKAP